MKHLLRVNLYLDLTSGSDREKFDFERETTTGKEVLQALVTSYPAYTYTQDSVTGVIWIHPRKLTIHEILSQRINIEIPAHQVPASRIIFSGLCTLLSVKLLDLNWMDLQAFAYGVELPTGVYSARDVLNFCCIANPSKAFLVSSGKKGQLSMLPRNLSYANPLAPPRAAAVRFWEIEIGSSANGTPSPAEISAAMSDANPRVRWASRAYLEATKQNYQAKDLFGNADSPEKAAWSALGYEAAIFRGVNDPRFLLNLGSEFTDTAMHLRDPGLALLVSLELAREKQITNSLDIIVTEHKFSASEIASIKPDVYRLAHQSVLVLNKLKVLKLEVPEFAPEALRELEHTNFLKLVPAEKP